MPIATTDLLPTLRTFVGYGPSHVDILGIKRHGPKGRPQAWMMRGIEGYASVAWKKSLPVEDAGDNEYLFTDVNGDQRSDLVCIKKSNTTSDRTEVTVLSAISKFESVIFQSATGQHPTGDMHQWVAFNFGRVPRPHNHQLLSPLVCISRWGTASGTTEMHVLGPVRRNEHVSRLSVVLGDCEIFAGQRFQDFIWHTATDLPSTDSLWDFCLIGYSQAGHAALPGLAAIHRRGDSDCTELHVLKVPLDVSAQFRCNHPPCKCNDLPNRHPFNFFGLF